MKSIEEVIKFPVIHHDGTPTILDSEYNLVADVGRWGTLLDMDPNEDLLNSIGKFIELAINKCQVNDISYTPLIKKNIIFVKTVIKFPVKYSSISTIILDDSGAIAVDIRGWGRIQYLDDAEEIQDMIGETIAKQMNKIYKEIN